MDLKARLSALFGLGAAADEAAILAHATTLTEGAAAGVADPARFVPIAAHEALLAQVAELTHRRAEDDARAAVGAAMQAGRLAPAQKDWALDYARKDLAGFNAFAERSPVIVTPGTPHAGGAPAQGPAPGGDRPLDDEDLAVCARLGITADQYRQSLKAEAGR